MTQHAEHPRGCAFPGCEEVGEFPAPKARDRLREYYWFCLDHVRLYNKAWNYYQGMSEAEIEAHIRHDTIWRRPTWSFGSNQRYTQAGIRDEFGFFDEGTEGARRANGREDPEIPEPQRQALAMMELEPPVTLVEVKTRYKELVKRLHPDANGGDREAEERLKLINEAYNTLRTSYLA